jgi:hypothetical protein
MPLCDEQKAYCEGKLKPPSKKKIEKWLLDEELVEATDGCKVEPDGTCPHGKTSWLIILGYI